MNIVKSSILLIILFVSTLATSFAQIENQPNILIIMTDQQAWDAVGYSGNKKIITPNLDKLASEGVNFSHAITACPVCVPSRTSILTGRLTETTTIRENRDAKTGECYYPTFDEILVKRGYRSEYAGKFHAPEHMARVYMNPSVEGMVGTEPIMRWESLYVQYVKNTLKKRPLKQGELYETTFYGGTVPYKLDPTDRYYKYMDSGEIPEKELEKRLSQADIHGVLDLPAEYTITAVQGRQTIDALERLKDEQFILTSSFHCPHVPITPSEPYASMYKADDMVTSLSIADRRENSPYNPGKEIHPYNDKEKVKYMVANYFAFVTEIDDWVGKILGKLDELNLTKNTLVVFVSDHGEMLGSHGMRGKFNFYEESVRVPFIIRYPGKIKPEQTISTPVSILNIFPTVLDYAGLKNIATDGYSLKGVMEGTESPKYDFAVSEWQWKNASVPSIMIRTDTWKLMTTHRSGGKNIEALFDLKNDPYEMNNLLGSNPERFKYKATAEDLRSKLVDYLNDVNYSLVEGVEKRVLIRE
ncbi:MAG: sulfatase-like hydrolase/transferase [Prolixibacteraceae bacterium]|jgi:arylsulfatase A-like enzyme|nr:sulfatase-like hydrolase/transferase [Prolixibacteraceae bacterium]MBT6765976.1 sulfatase-like hydrolase/transferase [Prolixibacteraceae bacterium]MBT7000886.1 sulfatase-like hydrolase/transferase [Prolixibacteraceae bacterium]MBT7397165.1 sulfatase-like hydrolase/transferase [Prolixibacteraceae bacterium]